MLGMMKVATYNRMMREKNEQMDGLLIRLERATMLRNVLYNENAYLRARLAPFTKIRNRDSRGRFIKDAVA